MKMKNNISDEEPIMKSYFNDKLIKINQISFITFHNTFTIYALVAQLEII